MERVSRNDDYSQEEHDDGDGGDKYVYNHSAYQLTRPLKASFVIHKTYPHTHIYIIMCAYLHLGQLPRSMAAGIEDHRLDRQSSFGAGSVFQERLQSFCGDDGAVNGTGQYRKAAG